jgi:hypothetical protein
MILILIWIIHDDTSLLYIDVMLQSIPNFVPIIGMSFIQISINYILLVEFIHKKCH